MGFKLRIVLEGHVDGLLGRIELFGEFDTGFVGSDTARTEAGDFGEGRLVEVDGLLDELGGILENVDALEKVVVDGRGGVLDLLLELLEVAIGFGFLAHVDKAADDEEEPDGHVHELIRAVERDGHFLFDNVDIASFVVD